MIGKLGILSFSPTGSTQKICMAVAKGTGFEISKIINSTLLEVRNKIADNPDSVLEGIQSLVVGAPVYSGKLPIEVIECLKSINGLGVPTISVVAYGNRNYGIALSRDVKGAEFFLGSCCKRI